MNDEFEILGEEGGRLGIYRTPDGLWRAYVLEARSACDVVLAAPLDLAMMLEDAAKAIRTLESK